MSEPILKPVRHRSPEHLARLRSLPCSIPGCKRTPVVAHHLTCSPNPKARGLKAGDQWAVSLCESSHHSAQSREGVHHTGDERQWWADRGIDPIALAVRLWLESEAIHGKVEGD